MSDPSKWNQESILALSRTEAISRGMTFDLTSSNTRICQTCKNYFGSNSYVSISKKAIEVLHEAMKDSHGLLNMDVLILGICLSAKHETVGKDKPETTINKVNDFLFPYTVFTQRLGAYGFIFRCVTRFEENYRNKIVTILHVGDR